MFHGMEEYLHVMMRKFNESGSQRDEFLVVQEDSARRAGKHRESSGSSDHKSTAFCKASGSCFESIAHKRLPYRLLHADLKFHPYKN
ncbi:hypothetical protein C0J52_11821 [Blattella germanica]|nr:hypothetical protein C0J52_11821 [Blattella germanica]